MLRSHDLSVIIQVHRNLNKWTGACLLHHNWSGKGISHNNTKSKHVSISRGNISWIRLLKVSLKQHWSTYTLTRIIAEQVMYKKTLQGWGGGSTEPLVTFEVLSTHKGWSLSKAWGLRTYSVQSQGLLQRKVKPHRPMSWGLRGRKGSSAEVLWPWYHVELCELRQEYFQPKTIPSFKRR